MEKYHTSRSHRHPIDNIIMPTDCSAHGDDSHLIAECQHRNNHNSGLISHDDLIKTTTSKIALRKRRTNHHHQSQVLLSPNLLILIRLIILFIVSSIFYYIFISIYSKPKQTEWEYVWYKITDWLSR